MKLTENKSEDMEFSNKEVEAIKQFRENLTKNNVGVSQENLDNDDYLIQWLRVKNLDVIKAEAMLTVSLNWRNENRFENLLSEVIPGNYYTNFPYFLDGQDRDGRTIISYSCGTWDLPKLMAAGERDSMYRYAIQMFARLEQISMKRHRESKANKGGKTIPYESIWVVDVKGSSLRQLMCFKTIEIILELTSSFEKNFPEMVNRAFFINASSIFTLIFKLMKPFITARTMSNIEVYGSDEKKWKPIVLENIDPDQLRPVFGGTKELIEE